MIRFVKFLLVVVLVTAGSAGVSGQAFAAEPCANADTSASFLSQEEAEAAVLCLANVERANAGLPDAHRSTRSWPTPRAPTPTPRSS